MAKPGPHWGVRSDQTVAGFSHNRGVFSQHGSGRECHSLASNGDSTWMLHGTSFIVDHPHDETKKD